VARGETRTAARLAAVQALYQMEASGCGILAALEDFENHWRGAELDEAEAHQTDITYFRSLLSGVVEHQRVLDPMIDDQLKEGWPLKRIDAVLRAILRVGVFELMKRKDVPTAVVINESVEIARSFFDADERKMVNALMDALAQSLRADELKAAQS
jgi:transcription antitermination protein NusB